MLLDALTVAVLAVVGFRLVSSAVVAVRSDRLRRRWVDVVRGLRVRHFVLVPLVLGGVGGVVAALWLVPPLRWGWWTAVSGSTGNVITGTTDRPSLGPLQWAAPLLFLSILLPLLPLFAEREEHMFREGAEDWSFWRRARRSVEFGLIHLIMGIPVAVALALSVGGGYFTWAYLRGYRRGGRTAAVLESTRAHLAYNLSLVVLALTAVVLLAVAPSEPAIKVTSSAFRDGAGIPVRYSCKGESVPPPLAWTGLPANTKQIAFVAFDPDAPGGTFVHWIKVGSTDVLPYRGMCPPPGKAHHYVFEVLALRHNVDLPAGLTPLQKVHRLEDGAARRGTLTGTFRS